MSVTPSEGGSGAQPPCSHLSPPCNIMSPLIESIKCYFMPKTNLASSGEPPASQNHFNHW